MRGFWILVHVLGFTLWLGGGIATMVAGVTAKGFAPAERLSAYNLIGAIQRILVGPGAMAVLLSGLVLAMPYMKSGAVPAWMGVMMLAGTLGALRAVTISEHHHTQPGPGGTALHVRHGERKRTPLNSTHNPISY